MIAKWKDFTIHAWYIGDEHIHLYFTIPPKYSIAYAVAVMKGKSSAWIKKKTHKFPPGTLWCRGYFITTIGINEFAVKKYIENQRRYQTLQSSLL
jgi:putative transposase